MLPDLVAHLWQSTLFVVAVWLATLALRRHGARVRFWLWAAASVKFLVPVAWLVTLGAQFEWRTAPAIAQPAASFVMEQVLTPPILDAAIPATAPHTSVAWWIPVGIWLVGLAAVLLWWWRQWIPVRAAVRGATVLRLDSRYDVRGLTVMSSRSIFEPGIVGIRRPVLVVPEGLVERLTPSQLQALIAHERCHVRCHDNLFAAVHMLVEAVLWFHPLVWWIERRMIDERERACDEAVLRAGNCAADYAQGILTVCRWSVGSPVACVAGVTGSDLRRRIETIMANRVGRRLALTARVLLAGGATIALAGPIGLGLLSAQARERSAQSEPRPRFDVASIRRTPEGTANLSPSFGPRPGGTLIGVNNAVLNFIGNAYGFPRYRILGAPDWLISERYNLEGRSDADPSRAQMMMMLQTLLEDRFKLRLHRETKQGPVYFLGVARGGAKLRESKEGSCVEIDTTKPPPPPPPPGQPRRPGCGNNLTFVKGPGIAWIATRIDMAGVADQLAALTGRTVIDKTGLGGFFDIDVYVPPLESRPGVDDPAPTDTGPSPFTVLREQLGLTLEPGTGPVEYLVIDSVERPSEN